MNDHVQGAVELVIEGRARSLGGSFTVRRVLPAVERRMVGPFIFFDHMGPVELPPGEGLDVRPHPHVCLATVTYLFEGAIVHKDSLGSDLTIRPGAINWMTAGRGIVHSERSSPEDREKGQRLHGIQLWVALPHEDEEMEPAFSHTPSSAIPEAREPGAKLRVLLGRAYGTSSPVVVRSSMFYVEAEIQPGAELELPSEYAERAAYVVDGRVRVGEDVYEPGAMIVFREGAAASLRADDAGRAHVMLLGGAPMDGPRHVFWNFVASSKERIEQAKRDWQEGRFPKVPGDELEFIPLPE